MMDSETEIPKKKPRFVPPIRKPEEVVIQQADTSGVTLQNLGEIIKESLAVSNFEYPVNYDSFPHVNDNTEIIGNDQLYLDGMNFQNVFDESHDVIEFVNSGNIENNRVKSEECAIQSQEINDSPVNLFSSYMMSFGQEVPGHSETLDPIIADKDNSNVHDEENENILLEIGVKQDHVYVDDDKAEEVPNDVPIPEPPKPKRKRVKNKENLVPGAKKNAKKAFSSQLTMDNALKESNKQVIQTVVDPRKFKFPNPDFDKPFTGNYKLAEETMKLRHKHCLKTGEYDRYDFYSKLFAKLKNSDYRFLLAYRVALELCEIADSAIEALLKDDTKQATAIFNKFYQVGVTATAQKYVPHFLHLVKLVRGCNSYPNELQEVAQRCYYSCQAMYGIPYEETFESVFVNQIKDEKLDKMLESDSILDKLMTGMDETFYLEDSSDENGF